ncbi:MAG: hypothetical protein ICV87_12270, partial [Gemmatimonadetes bacterium]|nr:hypothetical protein [Gemmatimonadota bacterium]
MAQQSGGGPRVAVVGDVHVDVVLARMQAPVADATRNWIRHNQYGPFRRPGGAWLLQQIVRAAVGSAARVTGYSIPKAAALADIPDCPVSFALLQQYRKEVGSDKWVYRLNPAIPAGWLTAAPVEYRLAGSAHQEHLTSLLARVEKNDPEIVVVHDHNNGFRELDPAHSLDPLLRDNPHFQPGGHGLVVWHPDAPLEQGKLWKYLCGPLAHRVVAVVNEDDLRDAGLLLRDDQSLERGAYDFFSLLHRAPLRDLARCAYLLVRFPNGSMLYSPPGAETTSGETFSMTNLPNAVRRAEGNMVGST